jgi:hypothetical protein
MFVGPNLMQFCICLRKQVVELAPGVQELIAGELKSNKNEHGSTRVRFRKKHDSAVCSE